MKNNQLAKLAVIGGVLSMIVVSRAQNFDMVLTYAEAPTATNSSLADTSMYDFNSLSTYTHLTNVGWSGVGTYDQLYVINADQYGGAAGSDYSSGSPYPVASASSGLGNTPNYTLTLNTPAAYFGLWWSAGDGANILTFYNGGTQVAQFTTQSLMDLLARTYYGNPTPGHLGQDAGEPFGFINFYGVGGTTFDKITLTDNAGSGFESDNHTVRTAAWGSDTNDVGPYLPGVPVEEVVNVAGSQTVITNTALMNPLVVSAPEPGMNALFAMAGLAGLAMVARRRAVKA